MSSYFEVVNVRTGEVLSDLPSPMLIQAGGGEAFSPDGGHFWRLREPSDKPGTAYTRVRVRHLEDWSVDFHIKVTLDGETEEYDDWFPVKAEGASDAINRATKAAYADIEQRYGSEVEASSLNQTRVAKGFRL